VGLFAGKLLRSVFWVINWAGNQFVVLRTQVKNAEHRLQADVLPRSVSVAGPAIGRTFAGVPGQAGSGGNSIPVYLGAILAAQHGLFAVGFSAGHSRRSGQSGEIKNGNRRVLQNRRIEFVDIQNLQ